MRQLPIIFSLALLVFFSFDALAELKGPHGLRLMVVTNGDDDGPGSLRAAINAVNNDPAVDPTILVAIHQSGIALLSPLPAITRPGTTIDARDVQASNGNVDSPSLVLNGAKAGPCNGFVIAAKNVTIAGIQAYNFSAAAFLVLSDGAQLRANSAIGTGRGIALINASGGAFSYNTFTDTQLSGIAIWNGGFNLISHTTITEHAEAYGIVLVNSSYNRIEESEVDKGILTSLPAIDILGNSQGNQLVNLEVNKGRVSYSWGGPPGIRVEKAGMNTVLNQVNVGNEYIVTSTADDGSPGTLRDAINKQVPTGGAALHIPRIVFMIPTTAANPIATISALGSYMVYYGTIVDATTQPGYNDLGAWHRAIQIEGHLAGRNGCFNINNGSVLGFSIMGFQGTGILVNGAMFASVSVMGNNIGVDGMGRNKWGNLGNGIELDYSNFTSIIGNVISGNGGDGIQVNSSDWTLIGSNFIGLASDGITPMGNGYSGIHAGPDVSGLDIGVRTVNDPKLGSPGGNFIAANGQWGIFSRATNTAITGNSVGVNILGQSMPDLESPEINLVDAPINAPKRRK